MTDARAVAENELRHRQRPLSPADRGDFVEPVYMRSAPAAARALKVAELRSLLEAHGGTPPPRARKAELAEALASQLQASRETVVAARAAAWDSALARETPAFATPHSRNKAAGRAESPARLRRCKFYCLRFRRFFFAVGVLTGAVLTLGLFRGAAPGGLGGLSELAASSFANVALDALFPTELLAQLGQLGNMLPKIDLMSLDDEFVPGTQLVAQQGLRLKHPVVLIPGIVSTGLEVWNSPFDTPAAPVNTTANATEPLDAEQLLSLRSGCALKYFRKRLWGTLNQFRALLMDRDCWMQHMMLDPVTGLDPPGVRLRAAQGLDAADYLFPGYWVWAKVIASLATLGYDSTTMHFASYDWRLAPANVESRDLYFTRLKMTIEILVKQMNGEKVVVVAHSMGSNYFFYFMSWVRAREGDAWLERHLHRFVNVAGPLLGVPKSISSFLSGEMRDTAQMNRFATYLVDRFLSRRERAAMFRSWIGSASMLPKGGAAVWGERDTAAPDDLHVRHNASDPEVGASTDTAAHPFVTLRAYTAPTCPFGKPLLPSLPELNAFFGGASGGDNSRNVTNEAPVDDGDPPNDTFENSFDAAAPQNGSETAATPCQDRGDHCTVRMTANEVEAMLRNVTGPGFRGLLETHYSTGIARSTTAVARNRARPAAWGNPLEVDLPALGSNFKIVCMYGVGRVTERGYHYRAWNRPARQPRAPDALRWSTTLHRQDEPPGILELDERTEFAIDTDYTDPQGRVLNGIVAADGDGTVPLVSLGYMCSHGWRHKRFNPHGVRVVAREYRDQDPGAETMTLRGGARSGDHIDIMGNHDLLGDLLRIVSGSDDTLKDRIVSRIHDIGDRVRL